MVSNHLCSDSCFATRTSEKFVATCFLCEKRFNSKCFDLASHQKIFSSTNNALFMCYKCIERVSKLKHNLRRSNESNVGLGSARNDVASIPKNSNDASSENAALSQILSMLQKMDTTINQLSSSNDELRQHIANADAVIPCHVTTDLSMINQSVINLHAKIDHESKMRSELEVLNASSVMEKLHFLPNNVPAIPATPKSNALTAINMLKKPCNKPTSTLDPLNWPFSFNQSLVPSENGDLFQLLHGFKQNTWTSFDYLCRKLNENTDAISQIESMCKEINKKTTDHQLSSPLLDSILLLQTINEKCDSLDKNLIDLDSNVRLLHTNTDFNDNTTQHLRKQYMKLIDSDNGQHATPPNSFTTDDLQQY